MTKCKKEIIIRRIDLIEAHDENNDVDIDIIFMLSYSSLSVKLL